MQKSLSVNIIATLIKLTHFNQKYSLLIAVHWLSYMFIRLIVLSFELLMIFSFLTTCLLKNVLKLSREIK